MLISVVIPCYNSAKVLSTAIESVFSQTVDSWEIIVVNDGSTDTTEEIVKAYISQDTRIRYYSQTNSGVSKARNRGVDMARGKYILFLDADDYITPTCVQEACEYLDKNPDCSLYILGVECFNSSGRRFLRDGYSSYRNLLLYGQSPNVICRREDFVGVGGFDERMRKGCEDWEFFIRFLYPDKKAYQSEKVQYYYRKEAGQDSVSKVAGKNIDEVTKYIVRKHQTIYDEFFGNPMIVYRQLVELQWAERRLPQMARKIQMFWQHLYDRLKML